MSKLDDSRKCPLVSIIILNHNGKEFVKGCLESVLNTYYPDFEVIFVDNASTDGSVEFVQRIFGGDSRIGIVRNHMNLGPAAGYNVGIREARGDYIVLLNMDTKVDPTWLDEIVWAMEGDKSIGACGSKLLLMDNPRRFDSAGISIDFWGFTGGLGRGMYEEDVKQYDQVKNIFSAKGAAIAIAKNVLQEVGLLDPRFFMYYEEIDLCWRIWLRGYRIVFVPRSVVYHKSMIHYGKKQKKEWCFHIAKNRIAMLIKNYELPNLIKNIPYSAMLILCGAAYSFCKLRIEIALGLIKAVLWNLKNLRYLWAEHVKVQCLVRRVSDTHVMAYMRKPDLALLIQWERKISKGDWYN